MDQENHEEFSVSLENHVKAGPMRLSTNKWQYPVSFFLVVKCARPMAMLNVVMWLLESDFPEKDKTFSLSVWQNWMSMIFFFCEGGLLCCGKDTFYLEKWTCHLMDLWWDILYCVPENIHHLLGCCMIGLCRRGSLNYKIIFVRVIFLQVQFLHHGQEVVWRCRAAMTSRRSLVALFDVSYWLRRSIRFCIIFIMVVRSAIGRTTPMPI